jgi:endonuclease/exonuclease/phosphatase family metal-dependent hydrolase
MIITSLNLYGRMNDWPNRQDKIIQYLLETKPDFIFFQEVVYLPDQSPFTQVKLLNDSLGYVHEHTAVTRLQEGTYREGLATLSAFPILKTEVVVLKQHPLDHLQRIIQLVDSTYNSHIVKFCNIHLAEKPEHAHEQLLEVLSMLDARNEQRIIIGDFNMPFLEKTSELWKNNYIASTASPYISYPTGKKRLDYVLLPKEHKFVTISLSNDKLSDHCALTATISL